MRSSSAGLARPVRTEPNSWRIESTDLSMRSRASCGSSSISAMSAAHQRAHSFAANYPIDVALVIHVEHVQRQLVLHAEGQRGGVHHAQLALDRIHVGEVAEE